MINDLIDQIPIRHNFTSTIMLLGVAQKLLLIPILGLKNELKQGTKPPSPWFSLHLQNYLVHL